MSEGCSNQNELGEGEKNEYWRGGSGNDGTSSLSQDDLTEIATFLLEREND